MNKRTTKRRALSIIIALTLVLAMLTACGGNTEKTSASTQEKTSASQSSNQATTTSEENKLPPVELTWYFGGSPDTEMKDLQSVNDEINKITKDKINAAIKLMPMDWGTYQDKINLKIQSQEEFDLCYTSSWCNIYTQQAAKGAYVELDSLLAQYGKAITSQIPAKYWEAAKINGKLYGILNYQNFTNVYGYDLSKALVEKYGFDVKSVKSDKDLEPFLQKVKDGENGIYPILPGYPSSFMDSATQTEYQPVMMSLEPYYVIREGDNLKIVNIFETEVVKQFLQQRRDWFNKGYIRKDAVIAEKNKEADTKAGKYSVVSQALKPGNDIEFKALYGYDVIDVPCAAPMVATFNVLGTMTAVSKTSKNPDRAVMFYNLLFEDKNLYRILNHGIENKHYKKVSEDTIEVIADGGYTPNLGWELGNQFNDYFLKGQSNTLWADTMKLNEDANTSILLGFNYDPTPMKTQSASITAIMDVYRKALMYGSLDYEKALPELVKKLKNAGVDDVIKDMQKQVDEWRKANGK